MKLVSLLSFGIVLITAALSFGSPIGATNVIQNGNFETIYEDNGSGTPTATTVTLSSGAYTHGVLDTTQVTGTDTPSTQNIDIADFSSVPGSTANTALSIGLQIYTADGDSTTSFYANCGATSEDSIVLFQDLGAVSALLQTNTSYLLSVSIYSRSSVTAPGAYLGLIAASAGQTISTIQSATPLTPSSTGANTAPLSGAESTYTFTYTTGNTLPTGPELYVFLGQVPGGSQVNYDNLSLTMVPEPASVALLLPLAGILIRRRRGR